MSIENLYPFAGNHAIQNVTFAVEWSNELTSTELMQIQSVLEPQLKAEFSKITPQNTQKFSFSMDAAAPGTPNFTPTFELSGFSYEKPSHFGNAQSARSMALSKLNLVILINDYSRWDSVWSDVKRYLSIILPEVKNNPIHNIGLQYSDIFTWKADPKTFDSKLEFRENSAYLVSNIHNLSGLWHSHHGYIVEREHPQKHTGLDNINVNLLDNAGTRSLQIITSHRTTFSDPIWYKGDAELASISEIMAILHRGNKEIMYNLLSDDVCKKINLKAN